MTSPTVPPCDQRPVESRWQRRIALLLSALLLVAVGYGTGDALQSRLLALGETIWPGYADLRAEPVAPGCSAVPATADAPPPEQPPLAPPASGNPASADDDLLDSLFGESEPSGNDKALLAARAAAAQRCRAEHEAYRVKVARRVGTLRLYLTAEAWLATLMSWGIAHVRHLLVILLMLGAAVATAKQTHIALRKAQSLAQQRISQWGQLLANLLLAGSCAIKLRVDQQSAVAVQHPSLPWLWLVGFATLATLNGYRLVRPTTPPLQAGGVRPSHGVLTVPLYAVMALGAGLYFYAVERHPAGLAIYLQQLTEHAQLYLHVALYVWTGMLLKQTVLPRCGFDVLRSLQLPPHWFAFSVVAASALPTAYSGASGIFVIAAGGVVFTELRRAGARQSLALAGTALSGSLGVVLSPCLLVVIVASLNKQVTTDELFGWGWKVYLLTAALLFVALRWLARDGFAPTPTQRQQVAAAPTLPNALRAALPYAVLGASILTTYAVVLDITLGEHTAPIVLPVLLLGVLTYQGRHARKLSRVALSEATPISGLAVGLDPDGKPPALPPLRTRALLQRATSEATEHLGALLTLMSLSACLGGVIVRSGWLEALPESFGSVWLTMAALVVVLVLIGMVMDPYGAVLVVSAAIADIAYRNGIDPVQFWMVVLVAFELGYLTPPVALNHLLTQHVVAPLPPVDPAESNARKHSFFRRHETVLLPVAVMATALLIVAFGPLVWAGY